MLGNHFLNTLIYKNEIYGSSILVFLMQGAGRKNYSVFHIPGRYRKYRIFGIFWFGASTTADVYFCSTFSIFNNSNQAFRK